MLFGIGESNTDNVQPEVTQPEVTQPEVTQPEVTQPEVTQPEVTQPVTESSTTFDASKLNESVTFHTNSISTPSRMFCAADHGDGWKDVATEFYQGHQNGITGIDYL